MTDELKDLNIRIQEFTEGSYYFRVFINGKEAPEIRDKHELIDSVIHILKGWCRYKKEKESTYY